MRNPEILIIGAGPAGLAAAMELAKAQRDFLIVEKEAQVGGFAKTYIFKEEDDDGAELIFRSDNGPHRFFSKNPKIYKFIEGLLEEKWLEVPRYTRQYIAGKFYDYPINPAQALANVGLKTAVKMIGDYLLAQVRYQLLRQPIKSFEDHIMANFGRTLGNFNIINYTEKIWGIPASTIHPDWARQRIRGLSVGFLIKSALSRALGIFKTEPLRTLVGVFYYPEYGTGLIYETISQRLQEQGYPVRLNSYPLKIKHQDYKISEVIISAAGKEMRLRPEYLIESVPIKDFLKLLEPAPPPPVREAAGKIRYRDQVYLFITLDRERISHDHWIYFPESHIAIGRISEMKNFSQKMSPPGKTSLLVEYFCFEGDEIWNKSKKELLELTLSELEPLDFSIRQQIRRAYLFKQKRVYPIYDLEYKEHLAVIKNYLDQFTNLFYIGRPGRFRYNNQDHSLEMGMLTARSIIEGRRYDLDQVGSEDEYLEKGYWKPV